MENIMSQVIWVGAIYVIIMIFVGYYYSKKILSFDDYIRGGRAAGKGFPMAIVAASLLATNNDTGNVLGIPELTFGAGFGLLFWIVTFCAIVYLLMLILGPRLQISCASTLPDYVYNRYNKSERMRTIITIWSIVSAVVFLGVQFFGAAIIIEAIFGVSWQVTFIPLAFVVILYTVMGGIGAVAMTDLIQWVIITVGTALVIPLLFGIEGTFSQVVLANQPFEGFASLAPGIPIMQVIGLSLAASLWILADPALSQRFLSAESPEAAKKGVVLWLAIIYPWWLIMGVIGLYAAVVSPGIPAAQSLIFMAGKVFPGVFAAIVFTAAIAASMSTADSYLNVVASMFVNDIYKPVFKKGGTDKHYVSVARWTTVVVGILGLIIAPIFRHGIFNMALNLQMIFIASVVPVVVLGLLWKKVNEKAAFYSSLFGGIVALIWLIFGGPEGLLGIQAIYPSLGGALIIIIFGSLITKEETL